MKGRIGMENVIGPVLTDKEFFQLLDYEKYPCLNVAKAFADAEQYGQARHVFAEFTRTFFDKDKFFSLPSRVKTPAATEGLKNSAQKALLHEMSSCGTAYKFMGKVDWYSNHAPLQYKEWTWQLSRHSELVTLARAYRAFGDEKYAYGCAELIESWINQAVRPSLPCPSGATLCWRTIECGIRMGLMWPEILHTFIGTKAFTDDVLINFFKSCYEHSESMLNRFTTGNWLIHELNGLAQNGIFYTFFKDSESWFDIAFGKLEKELRTEQINDDGFQFELSPGYHGVVITHCMEIIDIAEEYGKTVPKSIFEVLDRMLMVYVKLMQASGRAPHCNDGGGGIVSDSICRFGKHFPENKYFKWFLSKGSEGVKPSFGSVMLENCGLITLRDKWDGEASAFFDAGLFGKAHQHEDKLNLVISNKEKAVVCESNTYAYDTSEYRKYCLDSRGHNVILVNGRSQNRRATVKWDRSMLTGRVEGTFLKTTERCDYAEGIYSEAFGEDKVYPATHKRSVIMLKTPKVGLPVFVVCDQLTSENENTYQALWHIDTGEYKFADGIFTSEDITVFLLGDKGSAEIVKGVSGDNCQGWIFRSSQQGKQEAIPTIVNTVKGGCVDLVTVFALHENGSTPIESCRLEGDGVVIVYKDGQTDTVAMC